MKLSSLRTRADHARANRELRALFRAAGARRGIARLYEGRFPSLFLPAHEVWLVAHALPNRYRNALGVGDPRALASPSPSIQLNLALAPGRARPQARFARDAAGHLWLAHTGQLGGRVPGISRAGFTAFLHRTHPLRTLSIDDRDEPALLLGTTADPAALLDSIASLVHAAHAYRAAVAAGLT